MIVRALKRFAPKAFLAVGIIVLSAAADDTFDRLISSGKFADAIKYAEDNIPVGNRDAGIWAKLGAAYEKQDFNEKALACFMVSLRSGKNYEAYLGCARVYNNLKQPETAVDMAKKAMDLKATGDASWEYARACIALQKPAEAKAALERVVESDPSNVVANRELGLLYYKANDYQKALSLLKVAMRSGPSAEIAAMIATACRSQNQLDSAIVYLKIASQDPKFARGPAVLELARIYFMQEQYKPCSENYAKVDQTQMNVGDFYQYAVSLEKSGESEDSYMRVYSAAAAKFGPSTAKEAMTVHEKVGRWYLKKKNFAEALAQLQFLYNADPKGMVVKDIAFLLADALGGMGNRERAIPILENVIARDPQNVEAYGRLSEIYAAIGQAEKAQTIQEKLVSLQPNNPKIQLALGQYNLKAGKFGEALKYFQKSFMLEPSAEAAEGMTKAAWEAKQIDIARDAAESALHYDSSLAVPQQILARIYFTEKNYQGARQLLEKIVKKSPGDKNLWLDLALCYEKTNDFQMLAEADKTIMSLDKHDVTSRVRYAKYAMSTNDLREALATYKDLMVLSPRDPQIVKSLAEISTRLGNSGDAVLYLSKYVELVPGDAGAERDLGNLLYDRKDFSGAVTAFRAALRADPNIKGFFKRYAELVMTLKAPDMEVVSALSAAVRANEANETIFSTLGDLYQKQGNFALAIEMYQRALQINPQNFDVLSALAACQAKSGKISDAILSYEQATAIKPGSFMEQKALGDLYSQQGKKSQAITAYKKYLDKAPGDSRIARLVGDYEFDQKNYKDAVAYLGRVSGDEAGKADYLFRYGTAAYQLGDMRKTEELFRRLIVITPRNADAFRTLYEIARKNNDLASAADYLKKYTALEPSDDRALLALGDLLYNLKDLQGSLAAYRAVLRTNPTARGFYERYVALVSVQGTPQEVMQAMNGAIAAGEATVAMYSQLGEIYKKAGNFPKAIQMFEKASQLDPKNGALLSSLAECQAKNGDAEVAAMTYEQAIAMNPAANREYKALGDLYLQLKKTDAAVRSYKKYLEKNSDNALAKYIGEQAMTQKNYPEAVKYLAMVGGADSRSPQFLFMYGKACYQARDDAKALPIYKQLSLLMPQSADVFNTLYELTLRNGTKDEALVYLKKYAELKPGDAMAQRTIGDLLYERKDRMGALTAYRTLVRADSSARGFYKRYAELVVMGGNEQEIVSVLSAAIAANEADVTMYSRLGDIFRRQGQYTKAASLYDRASQLDPKNSALLSSLAECQLKSGNGAAAAMTYEQAIAMNPSASTEYKALGDLYLQQKKTDAAVRSYKKYLEKNQDNAIAKFVGEQALDQKNYSEAVKYLGMVSGDEARSPAFLLMYGKACYNTRDESKALGIYKQLAVLMPDNADVFQTLYDLQSNAGQKDEALANLKKYAALKPGDASAQRTLGDMLYERKDAAGALVAYRAALKANPQAKGFYKRYAELVLSSPIQEEKIKVLQGAIEAGEADAAMYRMLADIYRSQGLCPKAIPYYQKSIQLDPRDATLLSSLADCQVKSGAVQDAILTYEQATEMNPAANKEYKALGDLYMQQKKTDQAIRAYKKYVDKNPSEAALAKFIGEEEYKAKNYTEAKKYLGMVSGDETKTVPFLTIYGKTSYAAKDYPTALSIYKQLALLTPRDPEVFKTLYEISGQMEKPDDVITYLKRYTALSPADAGAQKFLGEQLYDRKDFTGSFAAYQAALRADPGLKGFYKRYVELVLKVGRPEDRIPALNSAIAAGEADATMFGALGDLYKAAGNCAKAIPLYGKALDADAKNTALMFSQAECQAKSGQVKEATLSYEQALAMNPSATTEYKTLGDLYMQENKTDAALGAYRKYLEKSPTDSRIAKIVAKAAFAAKKYDESYKYYGMVKDDNSPDYLAEYGLSAIQAQNYTTAIAELEKLRATAGELGSLRATAYKALAEAYEKSGDAKKAAEVLNSYVKLPGVKDPDAAYRRAAVYESINAGLAATMYEDNIKAYPNDYRNYFKLGSSYAKQAATAAKGIKYLEKCASLADTIPQVWLDLGQLYGSMNRNQDMINAFRKYIQLDQQNVDAILKIGETLLAKKMTDDAMMFLEMANSLKDNDPKIMTILARGYLMTKRRDEGAKLIEKVIKVSNGNIDDDLRSTLIDVYLETGQYQQAITEINNLLTKKRTNPLLLKFAKALLATGMYPEAANAVEDIKATEPENLDAIMTLGRIQVAQKKYNEAIETYKEALYINQYYAPAMVERANVYLIQAKFQWAKTFYERALKVDPKLAMAHLGLARVAKASKDTAVVQAELDKAKELDPDNKEILDEIKSSR
ncbi:MAG: tetratricopeptide repeat protein [Chitinispirillaceae bacterium]|jgi:tetratricopeptide (TPR) repeat protein